MNTKMYSEYLKEMKDKELTKGYVLDVLNSYVNGSKFLNHLADFANLYGDNQDYLGTVFSHEIDEDSEEYFGENKVMFYYVDDDDDFDIIDFSECFKYLSYTADFYVKNNKEDESLVKEILDKIRKAFNLD